MKKFFKVCVITGVVMTAAGLLAGVVALAAGGRESARRLALEGELDYRIGSHVVKVLHDGMVFGVEDDDGDYCSFVGYSGLLSSLAPRYDYEDDWDWEAEDYYDSHYEDGDDREEDWEDDWEEDGGYHREALPYESDGLPPSAPEAPSASEAPPAPDSMDIFRSASGIFESGPLKLEQEPYRLHLEAGCGSVEFRASKDEQYRIVHEGVADLYLSDVKVTAYEKNGVLYLKHLYTGPLANLQKNQNSKLGSLIVYLPKDVYFEEVEAEVGACNVSLGSLKAGKVELKSGVSSLKADRLEADRLEIENGMGNVTVKEAVISGKLDIENAVGSVEIGIVGRELDYHVKIESALGSVRVGGYHFTGIGSDTERNPQAVKEVKIESGIGSVDITFQE